MDMTTLVAIALPWLFILACPVAMWWMMRGMNCHQQQAGADAAEAGTNTDEEVRLLKERIAQLEADRDRTGTWS